MNDLFPEPRAQAPNGGVRDDGDAGAGGVGGLAADGPQAAVVLDRRRAGAAGAAQAHPAPLHPAAAALQTEQTRRPRQLSAAPPRLSQPGTESSRVAARRPVALGFITTATPQHV